MPPVAANQALLNSMTKAAARGRERLLLVRRRNQGHPKVIDLDTRYLFWGAFFAYVRMQRPHRIKTGRSGPDPVPKQTRMVPSGQVQREYWGGETDAASELIFYIASANG